MNKAQKRIILVGLIAVAWALTAVFCEWGCHMSDPDIVYLGCYRIKVHDPGPRPLKTEYALAGAYRREQNACRRRHAVSMRSVKAVKAASPDGSPQLHITEFVPPRPYATDWDHLSEMEKVYYAKQLQEQARIEGTRYYSGGPNLGIASDGVNTKVAIVLGMIVPCVLLGAARFLHLGWRERLEPEANATTEDVTDDD